MKKERVRPEQQIPYLNLSTTRSGAPSLTILLLLNIIILCTPLTTTLPTTRTAVMLPAQAVQWMVTTAEQFGYLDVEGSKGHGAAELPNNMPYRTWDVWLPESTARMSNRERRYVKDTICYAIPWTRMPFKAACQRLVGTGAEVHFPEAGEVYDYTAAESPSEAFLWT